MLVALSDGENDAVLDVRRLVSAPLLDLYLKYVPIETVAWLTYLDWERDCEVGRALRELYDRQEQTSLHILAHNAAFDLPFLDWRFGCGFPDTCWDTMVIEQMVTAGLDSDADDDEVARIHLKDLAKKYLDVELDKELQTSFIDHTGSFSADQLAYAAKDARILVPIAREQWKEVLRHQLRTTWEIELGATPVFASMRRYGVLLDSNLLRPVIDEATAKMEDLRGQLQRDLTYFTQVRRIAQFEAQKAVLDAWLQGLENAKSEAEDEYWSILQEEMDPDTRQTWEQNRWFDRKINAKDGKPEGLRRFVRSRERLWRQEHPRPEKPKLVEDPIDLNSSQQLKAALSELLGTELENVRAATISKLLATVEDGDHRRILETLKEYKKYAKLVQAFGDRLMAQRCYEGRIHAEFGQIGTATGRPNARRPNLLQIPSRTEMGQRIRKAFRATPGYAMIVCDFSQMELRIVAEISGDQTMIDAFKRGDDIHTATARMMFKTDEPTDTQRKVAKTINFLTLYGGGAGKLRDNLVPEKIYISFAEAKDFIDRWRGTYKKVWKTILAWQAQGIKQGYTKTALGRKRFLRVQGNEENYASIQRSASNHPVQGGNADVTKLAMYAIQKALTPLGGRVLLNVYDEIVAEVPLEYARVGAEIVRTAMVEAAKTVLRQVPVVVDCALTWSWSEDDVIPDEVLDDIVNGGTP